MNGTEYAHTVVPRTITGRGKALYKQKFEDHMSSGTLVPESKSNSNQPYHRQKGRVDGFSSNYSHTSSIMAWSADGSADKHEQLQTGGEEWKQQSSKVRTQSKKVSETLNGHGMKTLFDTSILKPVKSSAILTQPQQQQQTQTQMQMQTHPRQQSARPANSLTSNAQVYRYRERVYVGVYRYVEMVYIDMTDTLNVQENRRVISTCNIQVHILFYPFIAYTTVR